MKDLIAYKFNKNIFIKIFPFIIILLLGLPALMLFKKGLLVASGDFYVYLDPGSLLSSTLYSWNERLHGGFPNFAVAQVFPFFSFWWFFEKIGLSLVNIQRLWTYSYFVLSGSSIFFLVQHIGRKVEIPDGLLLKSGAILSASLYMINMFTGIDMFSPTLRPVQAVLPLIFLLWMKGLENKSIKYAIAVSLASLLYSSSNHNLATVSPIYLIMFLYFTFLLFFKRHEPIKILKFGLITLILLLLFNLWWIYPEFLALVDISKSVQSAASPISFLISTTLLDALRLLGSWAWRGSYEGILYFPYALKYDQFPLVFLTYLIPVFCLFCLLFSKKVKREILFLELVFVIGLFLVKGILSPFGKIFSFLYHNFPGFWVYREPYTKFTLINVFSLSCLLGLGFVFLIQEIKKKRLFLSRPKFANTLTLTIWISLIGIILYNSYPFLTGEVVFDSHYKVMRSWYAKIPSYWKEAKDWFNVNDEQEWRLFVLPKAGYSHAYNWEVGMSTAAPVAHVLQEKPIVFYSSFPISATEELVNKIYDIFNFKRNEHFLDVLSFLNVKYILQQNDLDYKNQLSFSTYSPEEIKKIMSLYPEITKVKTAGDLDIYRLSDSYVRPKFYTSKNVIYSDFKLTELVLANKLPFSFKDNLVFYSGDLSLTAREKIASFASWFVFKAVKMNKSAAGPVFKVNSPLGLEFTFQNEKGKENKIQLVEGENEIAVNSDLESFAFFVNRPFPELKEPIITFQKKNPVWYKVAVDKSVGPIFLTFSESFNSKWEASSNKKIVSEKNHFLGNGFSNVWLLEQEQEQEQSGEFVLDIRYTVQKFLNISYIISLISLFSCLTFLVVDFIKRAK